MRFFAVFYGLGIAQIMTKKPAEREQEALEIIELATDDLTSLTKAFDLITEVVSQYEQANLELAEEADAPVIH